MTILSNFEHSNQLTGIYSDGKKGTRVSRRNPCPHCNSDSGCKVFDNGWVWCLRVTTISEVQSGYEFVKWLSKNMGAMLAPTSAAVVSSVSRSKTQKRSSHQRNLLSLEERNLQYLKLAQHSTILSSRHREHLLHNRGLSAEELQIATENHWVWTWNGDTSCPYGVTEDLPGILPGKRLANFFGFTIAALDPQGRICGLQLKTDSGDPKYQWISSSKWHGNGPQLLNGELPLFVWKHPSSEAFKEVWLCEGGLKSMLVAFRLWREGRTDVAVIGASGGWYGNKTFKEYLQQIGANSICLLPDAGAIFNPHISHAMTETLRHLTKWGYTTRVGWWQQFNQNNADIDELEDWSAISFISVGEFQKLQSYSASEFNTGKLNWLKALQQKLSDRLPFKGFGKPPTQALPPLSIEPVVEYDGSTRLDTWAYLAKQSAKFVLDTSATGLGKSWDSGKSTPELFNADQVIYLSLEHHNPTTSTLKSWTDLQPRHRGWKRDEFERLRRVNTGEAYVIAPNCGRYSTIEALRDRNIAGADTAGMVCMTCPYLEACQAGAVFGYLNGRALALKQPRLRAHPESLPSPTDFDYSNRILIWDEALTALKAHKTIQVKASDVSAAIVKVALKLPELAHILLPVLSNLHSYLSGVKKQSNHYGWSNSDLCEIFQIPTIDTTQVRAALAPDLSFLNTTEQYGVDLQSLPAKLRKAFFDAEPEALKLLELNWLPEFLSVLSQEMPGSLSISSQTLSITILEPRLVEIARSAKLNIFLDATATAEDMARLLGITAKEICCIRAKTPETENLDIVQVLTLGRLGLSGKRSAWCEKRLKSLVQQISTEAKGTVGIIDFKRHSTLEQISSISKYHWWTHSRGINDLENISTLIIVGVPCRNLSDLEAEFAVLYGRHPNNKSEKVRYPLSVVGEVPDGVEPHIDLNAHADLEFRDFVRRRILADINQAIGRLRAHRRTTEKLKIYFLADYPLDIPVKLIRASDVTKEASTKPELVKLAITNAIEYLQARGQKVTQEAVAGVTKLLDPNGKGYSQQHISRYRRLLISLLDISNKDMSKYPKDDPLPPEDVEWCAETYLPLVSQEPVDIALISLIDIFTVFGEKQWQVVWGKTSAIIKMKLLQMLLLQSPLVLRQNLLHSF